MIYQKPLRSTFAGRSDEELKRILAFSCCVCGSSHQVTEVAADDPIVRFKKLDPEKRRGLCATCVAELSQD